MNRNLDVYREAFKGMVLDHITNSMPAAEWDRLRTIATNRQRCVDPSFNESASSPGALLDAALSEDSISVDEVLIPSLKSKAIEIGQMEGQPLFYINGEGIYVWGPQPSQGLTLSFWATYPAYPPSW